MPAKKTKAEPKTTVLKAKKSAASAAKKAPKTATKSLAKTKAVPAKPAAPEVAPVITQDQIATRAYYIGERRQNMGWPGDPASDWIEAEAQLIAEAKRKK